MGMIKTRNNFRTDRRRRIRARVHGTAERPRLAVFRSLRNISVQLIDDVSGRTLASASNREVKPKVSATVEIAREVGRMIAERAKAAKITKAVFDRGGSAYHGQIQALADGARQAGLEF